MFGFTKLSRAYFDLAYDNTSEVYSSLAQPFGPQDFSCDPWWFSAFVCLARGFYPPTKLSCDLNFAERNEPHSNLLSPYVSGFCFRQCHSSYPFLFARQVLRKIFSRRLLEQKAPPCGKVSSPHGGYCSAEQIWVTGASCRTRPKRLLQV